jgi:hypothetical protein
MLVAVQILIINTIQAEKTELQDNNGGTIIDFNADELGMVKSAKQEIINAENKIRDMKRKGLPTGRALDLLTIAKLNLDFAVEKSNLSKQNPDLFQYREKMKDFKKVSDMAYKVKDELVALRKRIDESKNLPQIESVENLYKQAESEFFDERFERTMDIISEADKKLVELSSLQTRIEAIYEAASANIMAIAKKYQTEILIGIIIPLIIGIIFRQQIKMIQIQQKIKSLELERKILNEEKKKAQNNYFVKGIISENVYKSKMQVYSDMEREITRELAILKEKEHKLNINTQKINETAKGNQI